jgi:hypothetical protein
MNALNPLRSSSYTLICFCEKILLIHLKFKESNATGALAERVISKMLILWPGAIRAPEYHTRNRQLEKSKAY